MRRWYKNVFSNKPKDKLQEIKDNIQMSRDYFTSNYHRFHQYVKFIAMTTLSPDDEQKLNILQKPTLQFNILEAMISRLRGEFAKHEPTINVRAADGVRIEDLTPEFLDTMKVIEEHLREIFFDATNDALEYNIYTDLLMGGFSVVQIFTDYINEMSFEQNIRVERVFDPTLCGFDPLARESHKGDGSYCFMLYPKTKEEFEKEYGKEMAGDITYRRSNEIGGFSWSYKNQKHDIVMVADYYFKVKKKEKIVKLSNGHTILAKHYEELKEIWNDQGFMEQMPIILESRTTHLETIERYVICENQILSHDKTNYKHFPLVFIDGNSVNVQPSDGGASEQMTRPYVYHALGIQKLMNFAGQTMAAEIENMTMHKWIAAAESIPPEYADAYKNPQQASTIVFNAFYKENPESPLPAPREVQRTQTPPIIESTFTGANMISQTILGNYDSILATNDKDISGKAIQQGAMQCNAAAIPYLKGYTKGISRVAHIVIDLIPKFYVTPRSLPVMGGDGKRSYQIINQPNNPNSVDMKYNPNSLQVKVEIGVSSSVQKQVTLEMITNMMQVSEEFASFINSMGLEIILDNMDIRGIEELKAQAVEFMKKKQEAQEAQQGQPDPQTQQIEALKEIEMMKIEQQAEKADGEHAIQSAKVAVEKQNSDLKFIEVMAKIEGAARNQLLEEARLDSENARTAVETALTVHQHHREMENAARENPEGPTEVQ